MPQEQLEQIANDLVERAVRGGASAADAVVSEADEFSVTVRMRHIESLKEAASKALGLRVFIGQRSASSYSSDFSKPALDRLVERTLVMAKITSEDPQSGLPEARELGHYDGDLQLYFGDVAALSTTERLDLARRAEEAALSFNPRIQNSEGATFDSTTGAKAYANSHGFSGSYRFSTCALSVVPVAVNGGGMQRDYWYSVARQAGTLDPPEAIGRKAAARAIAKLGARKIGTCRVPVIFDAETARTLVGHVFEAVRGDSVYRSASFLAGKLDEQVAGENVTVLDDGLRLSGFGSRPFDDEGVPASSTAVIENGLLRNYLLNTYAARKLHLRTTGNASRGVAGPPAVGPKNFYLAPGKHLLAEMIRSVKQGLLVTELIGFGVNIVTGDYSRGAAGMWIENGELAYPVEEITIAGTLPEMLRHITEIGSELEFRGSIAAPPIRVEGLTVAGL